MGGSIAALLARRGFRVRLKDIRDEALSTALQHAAKSFHDLVARRRITAKERQNLLSALSATTTQSGFRGAELAIEAVVEDLEVKRQVLREVEPLLAPGVLFASNTSALSITALAEAAARPEQVVGIHFFNPVHRMPLIEVVRGEKTSEETLRAAERFAREIGKYPVRIKDSPGFLVNRLLMPYLNEAAHLLSEGQPMEAIDRSLREFGFPMGPFELLDEVGLDVAAKVAHILHEAFGERAAPAPLLLRLTGEKNLLGKKSGAGFYIHKGKRRRQNRRVLRMVPQPKTEPTPADHAAWQRRTVYPMVNEAARCLEEGIVASAGEVNVATVMGMAFPPFRGGLLAYADRVGLPAIAGDLTTLAAAAGSPAAAERYRPAALLSRLAAEGRTFASLPRNQESLQAQPAEEAAFSAGT
jgi:3-hydroxyacyl-CoA dehydrogenase/enoyl-CoA hydratase/3-hydroxybutyryl-CoA epimerase